MSLLEVDKINTFYGISHILFDVSLQIEPGEVVSILGRNGVGKTTLLRSVIGLTPPRSGRVTLGGKDIKGLPPFKIARLGVGFVPEDRVIFPELTVKENLEMGIKARGNGDWDLSRVYQMYPVLDKRQNQMGGTLSGGEQQMLTIARTLMGNPNLLLLDEPSEGLAPLVVQAIRKNISQIQQEGVTVLIAEQNSALALQVSQRAYILEKGQVSWQGSTSLLEENPEILEQYLGV